MTRSQMEFILGEVVMILNPSALNTSANAAVNSEVAIMDQEPQRVRRGAACGPNGDVGRAYALGQVCLSSIGRSAVAKCSGWPR
jgi:hypothetical protein